MKTPYKNILLIIFIFSFLLDMSAQQYIKGMVLNNSNESISIYQIDVYNTLNDTILLASETFENPSFEMKIAENNQLLLKIYAFGYEPLIKKLDSSKGFHLLDTIFLQQKDLMLNEVVITTSRQIVKSDGSKIKINVRNSPLKDLGSVVDIFPKLPGVMKINNQWTVLGKGKPLIYIDDKEVRGFTELEMLKAEDVAEITVDRNPSAAYDATYRAIIHIKTIPKVKDMVGLQVQNVSAFYKKYSNNSLVRFDLKKGAFSVRLTYSYGLSHNEITEQSFREVSYPDYSFYSDLYYRILSTTSANKIAGIVDFDLTKFSKIGIQYNGSFSKDEGYIPKRQYFGIMDSISDERLIDQRTLDKPNRNIFSAYYTYRKDDDHYFNVFADYALRKYSSNNEITEYNEVLNQTNNTNFKTDNRYNIYALSAQYGANLWDEFKSSMGVKYTNINNRTNSNYITSNELLTNKLKDDIFAIYFRTEKSWDKFNLSMGMRYEYDDISIHTTENAVSIPVKRYFSDFFPDITTSYSLNDHVSFELNYSKKINRPNFRDMSPIIFYEDSLSYISGSPYIKPCYIHNLSLTTSLWNHWSLEMAYVKNKDQIYQTTIADENKPNGVKTIPINIPKNEEFNLSLNYFLTYKKWSVNATTLINIPNLKIPYIDQTISLNNPQWTFSLNNDIALSGKFSLFQTFSYISSGYYVLSKEFPSNNLTIGFLGKFIHDKLIVSLEGTDLLDGSNWNNWDSRYLNIRSGSRGDYDLRGFKINFVYKFNVIKSKIILQNNRNSEILNRTN
jgi:hypothetical protein